MARPRRPDPPPRLCWWCAANKHTSCSGIASRMWHQELGPIGQWIDQPCECDCREGLLW